MNKPYVFLLRIVPFLTIFVRYFLPIWSISILVNVICFPSEKDLVMLLSSKSIITTIISIWIMLWGVNKEKKKKRRHRSKLKIFFFYFLPMIPYLELMVILCWDNLGLFVKKSIVYVLAYSVLAGYYTYQRQLQRLSYLLNKRIHFKKKKKSDS